VGDVSEPRKPVFGFLWAKPDPDAPVDAAYHQVRPVRVMPRGPVRVVVLVFATAATVVFLATALIAALIAPALPAVLVSAAVAASACFLILRGWVVGTFVSDEAVRIESLFGRDEVPWSLIEAVACRPEPGPFLGIPLPIHGDRVSLALADGRRLGTHVYAASPDLWLRHEAFDMARLRLENWAGPR
jgi:hypothetical protein